jgi:hypothetical protein
VFNLSIYLTNAASALCCDRLGDLRRRFESPNESNRWDKPLFEVNMMAAAAQSSSSATTESNPTPVAMVANQQVLSSSPDTTHPDQKTPDTPGGGGDGGQEEVEQQEQQEATPLPTVFSSWKSSKTKPKPSAGAAPVSTSSSSTASCVLKKAPGGSNVYFSGSRAGDSPAVLSGDGPAAAIQNICAYFLSAAAPQACAATNTVKHSSANLLYQIDKVCQSITQDIMLHQQKQSPGTPLVFKQYSSFCLTLPRHVSMAELQRHRRQYIKVNSQHPPDTAADAGKHYLEFLANQC